MVIIMQKFSTTLWLSISILLSSIGDTFGAGNGDEWNHGSFDRETSRSPYWDDLELQDLSESGNPYYNNLHDPDQQFNWDVPPMQGGYGQYDGNVYPDAGDYYQVPAIDAGFSNFQQETELNVPQIPAIPHDGNVYPDANDYYGVPPRDAGFSNFQQETELAVPQSSAIPEASFAERRQASTDLYAEQYRKYAAAVNPNHGSYSSGNLTIESNDSSSDEASGAGRFETGNAFPTYNGQEMGSTSNSGGQQYEILQGHPVGQSEDFYARTADQPPFVYEGYASGGGQGSHFGADSEYGVEQLLSEYPIHPASLGLFESDRHGQPVVYDSNDCFLDPDDLPIFHGLLMNPRTEDLLYPTAGSYIKVENGSGITIACTDGETLKIENENFPVSSNTSKITGKCTNGQIFYMGNELKITDYECTGMPKPIITKAAYRRKTSVCAGDAHHFQVAFDLGTRAHKNNKVLYDICIQRSLQTNYVVKKFNSSLKKQEEFKLPEKYIPDSVVSRISTEFLIDLYSQAKSDTHLHLTEGHLFDKEDFATRAEKLGTFYFANVQPMWSHLKEHNWTWAKQAIRNYANFTPVTVYSGAYGHLKDNVGKIYLGKSNGRDVQRVPEIFWTIVYREESSQGVVIVFHNTPSDVNVRLCNEVTLAWLTLSANVNHGVAYLCTYQDFVHSQYLNNIHLISPDLVVTNLLK